MPALKNSKSTQKKLAKNRASSPLSRLISTNNQIQNPKSTTDSNKDSNKKLSQNPSFIKSRLDFFSLLAQNLFLTRRLKAFITDIFMLYTPILYIATYAILGSAEAFRGSQLSIFVCFMIYAIIYAIFIAISGQTPGLKYANLKLIYLPKNKQSQKLDSNNLLDSTKISPTPHFAMRFFLAFARVVLWALGVAFVLGIFSPLFTRSRKFFYDTLTCTQIISINPHHIKI